MHTDVISISNIFSTPTLFPGDTGTIDTVCFEKMPPTSKVPHRRRNTKATRQIPRLSKLATPGLDRLPKELRLEIWRLTVEPRHVVIWQAKRYSEDFYFRYTPFPAALHVCRESRIELLRQYTPLSLSRPLSLPRQKRYHTRSRPRIKYFNPRQKRCSIYLSDGRQHYANYVNFAVDTVVFPGDYDFSMVSKALLDKFHRIQSVAIGLNMYGAIGHDTMRGLLQLSSLNSIYVILSGISEYNFKLYDPSTQYKLSLEGAPQGYTWSCLLSSFRRLIAKDWGPNPVPLQGLLATQEICPYTVPNNEFYCGQFRDWMAVTY